MAVGGPKEPFGLSLSQREWTKVSLRWSPINATAEERASFVETMASMHGGWTNSFDQLAELLAEERG